MQNHWNDNEFTSAGTDPLDQRVYTSRLYGREPDLVLHGGGNTSVKVEIDNVFGEKENVMYITGSGVGLNTVDKQGFSPLRLDVLHKMAALGELSDVEMMRLVHSAAAVPDAPAPSVEALLHAIIPFRFVDHTHADAVVTITNTERGMERIGQIYGDRMFIVPYTMPGAALSREVHEMTRDIDWDQVEGIILLNHGVITFGDDATTSYMRMIQIVTIAEDYIEKKAPVPDVDNHVPDLDLVELARVRRAVSKMRGGAVIASVDTSRLSIHFSGMPDVTEIASRGPLTPDHVTWTKRVPMIVDSSPEEAVGAYADAYGEYFERNTDGTLEPLDAAPRWAIWPGSGIIAFGRVWRETLIITDIAQHTIRAILRAEGMGGWKPLQEDDVFDVEYWDLQRAKLARLGEPSVFAGKVAIVTGGASGIGRACVDALSDRGASVLALDIDERVSEIFSPENVWGMMCDLTDADAVKDSVQSAVQRFGGVDILVSNAGVFPAGETIAEMRSETWERSIDVNLTSHRSVFNACIPFLEHGVDPAVIVVGSKNVPAPGHGAGAYSVAKAGLTQLARVAALELGAKGIRVNILHPDHVFDTAIWTDDVLEDRAKHYGMTVDEYKTRNILGVEIRSRDVAELVCALAGPAFSKTTGAQVPIDGGNDRVI